MEDIIKEWNLTEKEEKKLKKIIELYGNDITSIIDLTGNEKPSELFYKLAPLFHYLLNTETNYSDFIDDKTKEKLHVLITKMGMLNRKAFHPILKKVGPKFLTTPQIIVNRNNLLDKNNFTEDKGIILPDEPVIWAPNHGFKDDILGSVLAAKRHAYLMFGSLPQFYNTLDGLTVWINGPVLNNRKVKASRQASYIKAKEILNFGTDLILFPEAVWKKSAEKLLLQYWRGIHKLSKETGAKVIPMVHYIRDFTYQSPNNPMYTVIDDPIDIGKMSESSGLEYLREIESTWLYLLMERYGQDTRDNLLEGYDSADDYWDTQLEKLVQTADRYDPSIETSADFRSKDIVRPEDAFAPIANLQIDLENKSDIGFATNLLNKSNVEYAKQLVKQEKRRDFQRRF